VPKNQIVRNCVVEGPHYDWSGPAHPPANCAGASHANSSLSSLQDQYNPFRTWKRFSYARCAKRIADCIVATMVLTLFAPLSPLWLWR